MVTAAAYALLTSRAEAEANLASLHIVCATAAPSAYKRLQKAAGSCHSSSWQVRLHVLGCVLLALKLSAPSGSGLS